MSEVKNSKAKCAVIRIISSASVMTLMLLLIISCISIYLDGTNSNTGNLGAIFSKEAIYKELSPLFPLILLLVLILLVSIVLSFFLKAEKHRFRLTSENKLLLVKKRVPVLPSEAAIEERKRVYINLGTLSVVLVCMISLLSYLLNGDNFKSWDLENVMSRLLISSLPELLLSSIALYFRYYALDRSMEREFRMLLPLGGKVDVSSNEEKKKGNTAIYRVLLLTAALILIALGIMNGGARDVFIKAINICTECIGLG